MGDTIAPAQRPGLTGRWLLVTPEPRPGRAGLRLTITLDSAHADTVYGRVTHFFSGNMGIDPAELAPIRGTRTEDGVVRLPIPWLHRDSPGMLFVGRLARDTIELDTVRIGPDTVEHARAWRLVRRP